MDIAAFVAERFCSTAAPMGYKAFLVGVDHGACALSSGALRRTEGNARTRRKPDRHPDWFPRLDPIIEVVRQSAGLEWIGRQEMQTIFCSSERDSIRLLHKFGPAERDNALSLPRTALLAQLEAIRAGSTYAAFLRQRHNVVKQLTAARAEAAARRFRVTSRSPEDRRARLQDLAKRCSEPVTPAFLWIGVRAGSPPDFEGDTRMGGKATLAIMPLTWKSDWPDVEVVDK